MFTDLAGNGIGTEEPLENCYTIAVSVMQPFSRGTIRLSGPCAGATPLIDPNYLGDDRDIRTMVAGLRLAREIGQASAFDTWRGDELAPGSAAEDNEILSAAIKHSFMSYFHPVGTCAMGNNAMSVVDSELRVHGINGLRVADGSVMHLTRHRPTMPGALPQHGGGPGIASAVRVGRPERRYHLRGV